jgi:hypothetical protein
MLNKVALFLVVVIVLLISVVVYLRIVARPQITHNQTDKIKIHNHPETPLSEEQSHGDKEVYHVAQPYVPFEKAEAVCKQNGGKLASYDQMLHAYQHGSSWCSHGWTKEGTAFYPTTKKIWKKIQNAENPKDRNMCGHIGLNGGIFNKDMKFGVNCYGVKPKPDGKYKHSPLPKKKQKLKSKDEVFNDIIIAPFNRRRWSRDQYKSIENQS